MTARELRKRREYRTYIEENLLYHHRTLPIGEFAIGTEHDGVRDGRAVRHRRKTADPDCREDGPAFCDGLLLLRLAEEQPDDNPDGKEVIARANEVSAKRKEDPSKAYFGCHTDITIRTANCSRLRSKQTERRIPLIE